MSDKLNIRNEMAQLDSKNRAFYDELTEEERKKFSTFLMLRWGSSVQASSELQQYYVQSCNHYLNKHFFALSKHPKLQWLATTAISPGMGNLRHNWIANKKKEKSDSAVKKALSAEFPSAKADEIDLLLKINDLKTVRAYLKENGHEKVS